MGGATVTTVRWSPANATGCSEYSPPKVGRGLPMFPHNSGVSWGRLVAYDSRETTPAVHTIRM